MKPSLVKLIFIFQGTLAVFASVMAWQGREKYLAFAALLIALLLSLLILTKAPITSKGKYREIAEATLYVIGLCYISFAAGKISGDVGRILSSPTPKHIIWVGAITAAVNFAEYIIPLLAFLSGAKLKTVSRQNS